MLPISQLDMHEDKCSNIIADGCNACLGPTTRGCFMTRSSVLNLFWLNVAASGVGKSETRKRLVSEPLEYIFLQDDVKLEDFEVSKFTRAGELLQDIL